MQSIMTAQGFENQLGQYDVQETIGEGSCNPVWFAVHRISGRKVAIKAINSIKYHKQTFENQISEGKAMSLCQNSSHVVNFIEEFCIGDETFIVTQYMAGGDLLNYLAQLGTDRLPEDHARYIFK